MCLAYAGPGGRAFSFTRSKVKEDEEDDGDEDSESDELPLDDHLRPPT